MDLEYRNLTAEECKDLNNKLKPRSGFFSPSYKKYRETDVIITKYVIEAYSLLLGETGTLIGKAKTTSVLSKKIRDYFKAKDTI